MAIPIPHRASGFKLGQADADVTLDVFFDIQCPHSKQFWVTLSGILERYKTRSLCATVHPITISNHHQAWTMSLALMAVAKGDSQRFFDFATYLFEHQEQFSNSAFRHKTLEDQRQLAADFAHNHSSMPREELLKRLDDNDIYLAARTPIRYAATRAVWATPTVFINNADDLPLNFRSSLQQWLALLEPLINHKALNVETLV